MNTVEKIKALHQLAEGINPTIIYNEGWMIRLLVGESKRIGITVKNIDFSKINNWTSEAKISSPFEGKELKKNKKNETKTQADVILGDFRINYDRNAEIIIETPSEILGIIEAKMGSNLSPGIKNAKNYNQASRNICCLAYVTKKSPECKIFFVIVAPEVRINNPKSKFKEQIGETKKEIKDRFEETGREYTSEMDEKIENCEIIIISYEEWINEIEGSDVKKALNKFYDKCIEHNKIK